MSQPCSSSQHSCCAFFTFISSAKEFQHLFNKSEKGCKQNALCCSNHDWRAVQKPSRDIKAMQRASCCCERVCDIVISKPFTSNTRTEKIMEECQVRIRDSSDVTVGFNPTQKEDMRRCRCVWFELWVGVKMRSVTSLLLQSISFTCHQHVSQAHRFISCPHNWTHLFIEFTWRHVVVPHWALAVCRAGGNRCWWSVSSEATAAGFNCEAQTSPSCSWTKRINLIIAFSPGGSQQLTQAAVVSCAE